LGNLEQTIADYTKAIELDPDDALSYYRRGVAYDDLGNLEQAIETYEQYLEFAPTAAPYREAVINAIEVLKSELGQ